MYVESITLSTRLFRIWDLGFGGLVLACCVVGWSLGSLVLQCAALDFVSAPPPVRCIDASRSSFQGWFMVLLCVAGVPLLSERVLYMFGDSVCRWSFRPVQCCYCIEVRKPERETCMPAT